LTIVLLPHSPPPGIHKISSHSENAAYSRSEHSDNDNDKLEVVVVASALDDIKPSCSC